MAKPNYQFEKRQRELEKKKKKAEKDQKKSNANGLIITWRLPVACFLL